MKKQFAHNKFLASLTGLLAVASAVFAIHLAPGVSAATIDSTPDCDNVAIIKCGVSSEADLRAEFDKNTYGDLPKVFSAFGISRSEMTGLQNGVVWKDGRVTVGDKTVATGAMTAGRNFGGTPISGTKGAGKYSTSRFVTDGQTALVKMVNGKFSFAVVKTCGNPVSATPKAEEPKPTPKPEPKPEPKPQPKPVFVCRDLDARKISRTEYELTASGTASGGATITGYRFTFGDGKTETVTSRTITHTYAEAKTYTASVELRVEVDGKTQFVDGKSCVVTIKVTPAPVKPQDVEVCNPETGEIEVVDEKDKDKFKPVGDKACKDIEVCELRTKDMITIKESDFDSAKHSRNDADCEEEEAPVAVVEQPKAETPQALPSTGPADFVAGGLGLGSLTAAGYYFRASRRNLIEKFLNR